jgi:hypothetical protein
LAIVLFLFFWPLCCTFSFGHCVVLILLAIVSFIVLLFTDSDYPFGIFKLFLLEIIIPLGLKNVWIISHLFDYIFPVHLRINKMSILFNIYTKVYLVK